MIFWIENLVLWYRNNRIRTLDFENNKVNVVTGDSLTGKTAILQIIDYCLFASKSKLPENTINENVAWYGIRFWINDKHYTIARGALVGTIVSEEYYFSSAGELPVSLSATHKEDTLKEILEPEFGIDRSVTIPFGGKRLTAGSRISIRYFLLFNTISEDIITNSEVFFDKQNDPRYVEALERVFDLATGIEQISNTISRDMQSRLESELRVLQKRGLRSNSAKDEFLAKRIELIRRAKELGLVAPDASLSQSEATLQLLTTRPDLVETTTAVSERSSAIQSDIALFNRIIRNLKSLTKEYEEYKKHLNTLEDSLKPVVFLREKMASVVQTSFFDEILTSLEFDLSNIKQDLKKRIPISTNINDLINEYQAKELALQTELSSLPVKAETFANDREKYLYLGELKAKLEFFSENDTGDSEEENIDEEIEVLERRLASLNVEDLGERRAMFSKLLEEIITVYMRVAGDALGTYQEYLPVFDFKTKALKLRKPLTSHIENIGSSSNHMFLHLFLFLGLHEAIRIQKSPFVPPFLVIDQPSRPYWGDGKDKKKELDKTDEPKIRKAFELMNFFIERTLASESQCQLIVFEHVPPSTWIGLKHVHLVEEFTKLNALVRRSDLSEEDLDQEREA